MKKEENATMQPLTREQEFENFCAKIRDEVIASKHVNLNEFAELVEYIVSDLRDLAKTGRSFMLKSLIDELGNEEHLLPKKESLENFAYMLQCFEDSRQ